MREASFSPSTPRYWEKANCAMVQNRPSRMKYLTNQPRVTPPARRAMSSRLRAMMPIWMIRAMRKTAGKIWEMIRASLKP